MADRESNEGITWREFALLLLMSLLVMEKSLGGLSSYRKGEDRCQCCASQSFPSILQCSFIDIKGQY